MLGNKYLIKLSLMQILSAFAVEGKSDAFPQITHFRILLKQ